MFEEVDTSTLIAYAAIGLLIYFVLIYWAVLAGTSSQRKMMRIQTKLLEDIARKAGVNEEEIQASYKINDKEDSWGK